MKLSAELVVELGQLKAQIAAMQEREKELVDGLKTRMVEKDLTEFAPKECPFKLVLSEYDQTAMTLNSWKEVSQEAYRELYGKNWEKEMTKTEKHYGTKHVVKLECKKSEKVVVAA